MRSGLCPAYLGAAMICLSVATPAAMGATTYGVIRFTGRIVNPPMRVEMAPPAIAANRAQGRMDVEFRSASRETTGTTVQVVAAPGQAISARFTDRSGHLIAPSADGRYRVAAEGAHLALSGSGNGSAGASGAAGRTARLIVSWD
ncbi:hypothetical protein [Achromobacter sp. Marseille-Q4962]|uniref:hypothetical protein n=1 Tax=Achromobacter sp. Marseille-Q4962 TaxID=2942202 RepID=UPI0020738F92|nr:hypothetical protein [Achromobacter sp. Marseille-Q4962]